MPDTAVATTRRWELYKLLAEPFRLRILALAEAEELAIGELAEALEEPQPNVSRHLKALRRQALLQERREGTRVYVRLDAGAAADAVVADALAAGRRLCTEDGSLGRVAQVVRGREAAARAFFDGQAEEAPSFPTELPAYLTALAPLVAPRRLAVDVGCGDGAFLEVLAPIFERVVGVDRSEAQLERARRRLAGRQYGNVELHRAELGDAELAKRVHGGADAVFAARVLHHASRPARAFASLAELVAPGGAVVLLDYARHDDERLRAELADAWLGFSEDELLGFARQAGLEEARLTRVPAARCGDGPDGHLDWVVLVARRPSSLPNDPANDPANEARPGGMENNT
ncbi:MAG: metalloregulator ArsR/SmtB family transcription factor [Myxococcota bacterium]